MSFVNAFQKRDTKILSRSQTMSFGKPFSQYHVLKKVTASSLAVMVVFVGTIRMSEPRRSVIVRIQSYPSSVGNGPMKSIAMDEAH